MERVGSGAMGVVYAAYDPELDRKVALKVLSRGEPTGQSRERMFAEARALARLSHPHVVTVHDAGICEGRVYVAMEFVVGETLREWRAAERAPEEVIDVYRQAGLGLAAAHAKGIVHRDFKPENVMLGEDGRVRVVDFGLAATDAPVAGAESAPTFAGTPAYMAPEQHRGEHVDARTDQYAFCVALYESLYGVRPFAPGGGTLLAAKLSDRPAPAERSGVSPRVAEALRRGLRAEAAARWPTMEDLLSALAPKERRRGGTVALAIGLMTIGLLARPSGTLVPSCDTGSEELSAVWGPQGRDALVARVGSAQVPYAATAGETVASALDQYAQGWAGARADACIQHASGAESDHTLDLRTQCLASRRDAFVSLVRALAESTPEEVALHGARAASDLAPLAACADPAALRASEPQRDPRLASLAERVVHELVEARAESELGRYPSAHDHAAKAVDLAGGLGHDRLVAEALLRRGQLELAQQHGDGAASTIEDAFHRALAVSADDTAAEAAIALVRVPNARPSLLYPTDRWERIADALLTRGPARPWLDADLAAQRGRAHLSRGDLDAAEADLQRAAGLFRSLFGDDHPEVAAQLLGLGRVARSRGDAQRARDLQEEAHRLLVRRFGADHPEVARAEAALAGTLLAYEDLGDGLSHAAHALTIDRATFGAHDTRIVPSLLLSARAALTAGRRDDAARASREALTILTPKAGEADLGAFVRIFTASRLLSRAGQPEQAANVLEAILERIRAAPARPRADHVPALLAYLGSALFDAGRLPAARTRFYEAIAAMERQSGPRARSLAHPVGGLGDVALAEGHEHEATRFYERALDLLADLPGTSRAMARFDLAKALGPRAPARASSLAREALSELRAHPTETRAEQATVAAWVALHPPTPGEPRENAERR